MLIRPDVEALRGRDAPQREWQARLAGAIAAWREAAGMPALLAELRRFSAGEPLAGLAGLDALLAPGGAGAARLAGGLTRRIAGELRLWPLGQVPLRHHADDLTVSLMLAQAGGATLALQLVDAAALARRPAPVSASFSPSETVEQVLAGRALIERVRLVAERPGGAALAIEPLTIEPGSVIHRRGESEALLIRAAEASLVTLKLQRRLGGGAVTREYRLADGALLHQAAGDPRDSRLELAAALLGRMGRRDAAAPLAAIALEPGGQSLRWQALRECLALDSAAGFAALCTIAARADDPLAAPAAALRGRLIETYPQLAGAQPCPA